MAERDISRRQFLKLAGVAGVTIGLGGGLSELLSGCDADGPLVTVASLKQAEQNIKKDFLKKETWL